MIGRNSTQRQMRQVQDHNNEKLKYWYRQGIVDEIHEMYNQYNSNARNKCLWLPKVIDGLNFDLVKSAIILFGSWENALKHSGVYNTKNTLSNGLMKDYWSEEKIIEQLRTLHSSGFDLSSKFIKMIYPELYYAAKSKSAYGSWSNALSEAEIDLKKIRAPMNNFWSFSKIYYTLHDYDLAYGNVQASFVRRMNPSLYTASRKYSKSWSKVISMADLKTDRAFFKVLLEPFRTFILVEYVKKVFDLHAIEYRTYPTAGSDCPINHTVEDLPEFDELLGRMKLTNNYLETKDFEGGAFIIPSYRSWGFLAAADGGNGFDKLLTKYPRIVVCYSIGEPRRWFDDKIKFINLNQFYPELIQRGLDDVIDAIGTLARGGIPKEYNDLFNEYMKELKKIIKKNKKY